MKNLTKEQSIRKDQIANALTKIGDELKDAINRYNAQMSSMFAPVEELQGRFNELLADAQAFIDGVHEEQEAYKEERSDRWRDGDAGQAYSDWAGEWSITFDEVEMECPEPLDEPTLDALESLRNLPEHP